MTKEEKELLLKDLCARLPYRVKCRQHKLDSQVCTMYPEYLGNAEDVEEYEPYLRPMSSMTDEEYKEYSKLWDLQNEFPTDIDIRFKTDVFDWLNAHHFDYRGLIPMGLALEAPNEIYNNQK